MEVLYVNRYDRHSLDKLIGSSTEARLIEEEHVFTLSDGRAYERDGDIITLIEDVIEPVNQEFLNEEPRENL